jgi:hypothetical protein
MPPRARILTWARREQASSHCRICVHFCFRSLPIWPHRRHTRRRWRIDMHAKRESRHANLLVQLPLALTSLDVVRDEPRRSEVVALLARLLLQCARRRASAETIDDAS